MSISLFSNVYFCIDPQGKGIWTANLDSHKGGPYNITATSKVNGTVYNITLHDVLFGDVWICSGQSNMQFSISQVIIIIIVIIIILLIGL